MENKVIKKFKEELFKKYPDAFFTNIHSDGYGNQGMPDLIVKVPKFHPRVFFIEAKDAKTLEIALKKRRPTQKGMMRLMKKSLVEVYMLYDTKLAKSVGEDWIEYSDMEGAFKNESV